MLRTPIAAAALCAVLLAPTAALPCGNAVYLETKAAHRLLARAQKDLDASRYRAALSRLRHGDVETDDARVDRRLRLAVATARLRIGRIRSAVWTLDALDRQQADDPEIRTRLGEGLVALRTARGDAKALEILGALEQADLLTDAFGDLALARVRARSGDTAGAERALKACRTRARDASMCTLSSDKAAPKEKKAPDPRPRTS